MMITIVGSSKGVGKLFHEYLLTAFLPDVPINLISRSEGYNLNDNKEYKHVVDLCSESDIVFNNAPAIFQLDLVYDAIYNVEHYTPKDWLHVGTQLTDIIDDAKLGGMDYITKKQEFADFIRQEINKYGLNSVHSESLNRHCLLSLGAVETNQIDKLFNRLDIAMIDREYMFKLFDFILDTPPEYCLGEIRLVPDQYISPECNKDFEFKRHLQKYTK